MFLLGETAVSPKNHHSEQAKCPAGLLKAANKDSKKNHCSPCELLKSTKSSNCLWSSYTNTEDMWSSGKKFLFVHIKIHRKAVRSSPPIPHRQDWLEQVLPLLHQHLFLHLLKSNQNCDPVQSKLIQSKTPNRAHARWKQAGKRDEDAR